MWAEEVEVSEELSNGKGNAESRKSDKASIEGIIDTEHEAPPRDQPMD